MAENTNIEWATHTFNPWLGCTNVSPGCDNCYAEAWAARFGTHDWKNTTPRVLTKDANWRKPLRWDRLAAEAGERHRVFCASLADVFDPQAPQEWRERLWDLIEQTPHLDWLLLTKRPNLIAGLVPKVWMERGFPFNVWIGFTAEDQEHYDRRWKYVAGLPVAVRFVSYEPALGPLIPHGYNHGHFGRVQPSWIICGGESGPNARRMRGYWASHLATYCQLHDIPFFMKQWGTYRSNPLTEQVGELEARMRDPEKINGKGGALLDGQLHRAVPEPVLVA